MIKIENVEICGIEPTIRGMRNPMNSWDKSDTGICKGGDDGIGCDNCAAQDSCHHAYNHSLQIGKNDHNLMMRLAGAGKPHSKYRRMITVYLDIVAPLYWWKEFDTYKVGTVANSCSTMHKIHSKEFTLDDFSCEHLLDNMSSNGLFVKLNSGRCSMIGVLEHVIDALNVARDAYNSATLPEIKKECWWQMIQLLPSSYNQRRTVMLNYEVLNAIYYYRKNHKLDEWREFCKWIESLPYSELITCNGCEEEKK